MRIVGGSARGRRLVPPATGTRPTSDRTREALFNALAVMRPLDGVRLLDLYAGTGAVGLEALSRGATEAVFVESKRGALDVLRRNVATVGLPGARVVAAPVATYLATAGESSFDIVFADPPYDLDNARLGPVLTLLVDRTLLANDAVVVVERGARSGPPPWPEPFITPVRERRYGDAVLWYGRGR